MSTSIDRPRPGGHRVASHFIGGEWLPAQGPDRISVTDSGLDVEIGSIQSASEDEIDLAVAAAQGVLRDWTATPASERAAYLRSLGQELTKRRSELVGLIAAEVGTAVRLCGAIQVDSAINAVGIAADLVESMEFERKVANSTVISTPVGVVAAITPWNYPLFQTINKVAAALAAGCTVVHKPSELAPLTAFVLAEAVENAGLPGGTYNLLTGPGGSVGEGLCKHPGVSKVSFTGSVSTGVRIYRVASDSMKRLTLELGGKSPSLVLDDSDVPQAVTATVRRAFLNSGQTCDAWTRLLIPKGSRAQVESIVSTTLERLPVGDPFDEETRLGPLVSPAQVGRVHGFVERAKAEGAVVAYRSWEGGDQFSRGYFYPATVLADVTPDMEVAREEVFGPVLVLIEYEGEAQAIEIANNTRYGLSAAVWSGDSERAERIARQIRAGQVVINGGGFNPYAPFGGLKMSGMGREMGVAGVEGFLEPVAIQT